MFNEDEKNKFLELTKLSKAFKISIILSSILLIILLGAYVYIVNKPLEEPKYAIESNIENEYVYLDVSFLTDCFAQYETDTYVEDYYLAADENYLIILKLNDSLFNKLSDINKYTYGDIEEKPEAIRITGLTNSIPTELKELALEFYNKMYPDNQQTISTISDYIGQYYIDTSETPTSFWEQLLIIFIILDIVYILISAITIIINKTKTKKALKKLEENNELDIILQEYNNPTISHFEKQNVIFTNSYIIDYSNFLNICKYNDIVWFYPHIQRYNGVIIRKSIIILKNNKKKLELCGKNTIGKNTPIFDEIIKKLAEKCPNALIGYNNENIVKFNKKNIDNTIKEISDKITMSNL